MGVCESLAPDVFELNDQAELVLLTDGEVSDAQLAKVRAAVGGCPTGALRLAEDLRCPRSVAQEGQQISILHEARSTVRVRQERSGFKTLTPVQLGHGHFLPGLTDEPRAAGVSYTEFAYGRQNR